MVFPAQLTRVCFGQSSLEYYEFGFSEQYLNTQISDRFLNLVSVYKHHCCHTGCMAAMRYRCVSLEPMANFKNIDAASNM